MQNYPSNSYNDKKPEPRRKVEKVVVTDAQRRKKSVGKKLTETFTADDTQSVGQHILFEVLIPAAKTMISDAVSQGIERLLFGDSAHPTRSAKKGNYIPYNRASTVRGSAQTSGGRDISGRARGTHDFDEVILETRGEAEEVLDRLMDLLKEYDHATVSDMYDLVGVTGSFTDSRWGWTDLRGAGVRRVRAGYLLDLPRTSPID